MSRFDETLQTVMDAVRPFVAEGVDLQPDTELTSSSGLDSAGMLNVLLDLEARLGMKLSAADLTYDHFRSCRALAEHFANRVGA